MKKSFVLPAALLLGLLFHKWCALFSPIVPFLIFCILLLTFAAVDLKHLLSAKNILHPINIFTATFQIVISVGSYYLLRSCAVDPIIAEGVLVGVICPVAASVTVISCMLGANRQTVTTYTLVGNLMVALVAPLIFSMVNPSPDITFFTSFCLILKRIAPILGIPILVALLLQCFWPKANGWLAKRKGWAFYFWCCALLFTLGQTIDFIFIHGEGHWNVIIWLGILSLLFCAIQFGVGKWVGHKLGDTISGGQLLGQKNTAMGIWMANTFLSPLASVFMAFYSIYQNLFNSWQIYHFEKKNHRD